MPLSCADISFNRGQNYIGIMTGFLLFLFPAQIVAAWGPEGHRIIGEIAQRRLLPEVLKKIEIEFNIKHLADVSDWADQVKDARRQRNWHFTNIKDSAREYNQQRDCANKKCVTEIIPKYERVLADRSAPAKERMEALKYLVHFVGDVHQPLHLGNEVDRGGNNIPLNFAGRQTNLHALWDSDLILHYKKVNLLKYACVMDQKNGKREVLLQSQPIDWTNESRRLALDFAYSQMLTEGEAPMDYVLKSRVIIENQLCRAGIRLAHLLNQSLM